MAEDNRNDAQDDDLNTGDLFKDPEGFYPEEPKPTYAEYRTLSGLNLRVRLVGSHPLYGYLLWNAGRTTSEHLERHAGKLVAGKDVLEIGAAAGLPSIISAINGARTVVMTDYPDPDLVENMRQNADAAAPFIPQGSQLHVAGYKWGAETDKILSFLPQPSAGFDLLIMADVIYSHREHPNLISTVQRTLKRSADAVALVFFTPYQPWLLPKTEKFFPLAEENGFIVTKIFQKVLDKVLFENDPGDETLRRTVFAYELRWAPDRLAH